MLVRNWMTPKVVTVEAQDTMQHAAQLIKEHKINMLPVMEQGRVVGVLSKIDLKRAHATLMEIQELAYVISHIKVKEIMTKAPETVPPDYTIEEAAQIMIAKNISGLPVVEANGKLVGIITRYDLFKVLISLTGLPRQGVQFACQVQDRPGVIRELTDAVCQAGGRIAGILTNWEGVPDGFLRAYIRAYNLDREKMPQLIQALQAKASLLYFVDWRENRREIFQS